MGNGVGMCEKSCRHDAKLIYWPKRGKSDFAISRACRLKAAVAVSRQRRGIGNKKETHR